MPEAFYLPQPDGTFRATPATEGPWDPQLQHGGPPAALLGRAIESTTRSDMRVAHFTLDFLGPVPIAPMSVQVEVLRPGKRVELVSATALVGGRPALRASAWRIAVGADRGPAEGSGDVPPLPDEAATELFDAASHFGYGHALEWRFAEGGFRKRGPATVWSRMRIPLVPGESPSPLQRLLAMVDSANGISWELDPGTHLFVPVVLTVSITRSPVGEWVGMAARTSLSGDGVGSTRARLFDAGGTLGEAMQTLFVAPKS